MRIFCIALLTFFIQGIRANPDSLWSIWNDSEANDTARLESLNKYIWATYLFSDPDSAYLLAQMHYDFAEERNLIKYQGQALSTQGVSFAVVGKDDSAVVYYEKSLAFFEEVNYKKGIASIANNLGVIAYNKGNLPQAIENYTLSAHMMEEMGNIKALAKAQSNIGLVYVEIGKYANAIAFYNQSYDNAAKISDKNGQINALNNIAILYDEIAEHQKAIDYFKECLALIDDDTENALALKFSLLHNLGTSYSNINENKKALNYYMQSLALKMEIDNPQEIGLTLNNIGTIFMDIDSLTIAMDYFNRSYDLYASSDASLDLVTPMNNMAEVQYRWGNYSKSLALAKRSLNLSEKNNSIANMSTASNLLYRNYKQLGLSVKALQMLELYESIQDTLLSEENQKQVLSYSFRYEYEQKVTADSLKALEAKLKAEAQIATQQAQLEKEKAQRFALYGGLLSLLLLGGFMYNRFKVTQKQKAIIEKQKEEVEHQRQLLGEKNQEIMDSIQYAQRIQGAILPPRSNWNSYLGDSFVIYQPKDVVAGDFYWLRKVKSTVFFAVADCTGHGVPGALVSVVCNNALNRSVREYGLKDPGLILDKTREIVVSEFEKSDEEVKDGMDIALCVLEENMLKFAGANNPLWLIRNNKLQITKADRQPIGNYIDPKPYTTHQFDLQPDDRVYLFTDGITDQFGGENGKKFKQRALQELLLSIQYKDMPDQKEAIYSAFLAWKGALEQVDDVCMIGYRHA
jgi:serine phosphatase RsbU (regulator of sigma subunit)